MPRIAEQSTSEAPKVSVHMITYNHEEFVAEAIESILMQETNFVVEVVVGEDCSTDGTRQIVLDYAARYPRVIRTALSEQNCGMHSNFCTVLNMCRGEFVAFLEGDDCWTDSNKLQAQVSVLLKEAGKSFCVHRVQVLSQTLGTASRKTCIPEGAVSEYYTAKDLILEWPFQMSSMVARRKYVASVPNWVFELPMADWPIQVLAARYGDAVFLDRLMSTYRLHAGGTWSGQTSRQHYDKAVAALRKMSAHCPREYATVFAQSERKKLLDGMRVGLASGKMRDVVHFLGLIITRFGFPKEVVSLQRVRGAARAWLAGRRYRTARVNGRSRLHGKPWRQGFHHDKR